MTVANSSHGAKLEYRDGANWVTVNGITNLNRPQRSVQSRDVTTLADSTVRRIPIISEIGAVNFQGKRILGAGNDDDDPTLVWLLTAVGVRTVTDFRATTPDGVTDTFQGFVASLSPGDFSVGNEITFSGQIMPTGAAVTSELP